MSERDSNPLAERLRERIRGQGAISFRDWMEAALYDEGEGYYSRADVERWGRAGDYRTSPERSPLFAATFARFFSTLYEEACAPVDWTIWEAGAGAGHFAQGVLETLQSSFPHVYASTRYVIDERSGAAQLSALDRLAPFGSRVRPARLTENRGPAGFGIVFANELLDALPVHRVIVKDGRLLELCVGVDEKGVFVWVEREPGTHELELYFKRMGIRLSEGQVAEVNLDAREWVMRAAKLFERGFVVLVDYGAQAEELYDMSFRPRGTLRGFRRHRFVEDVLEAPGEYDLTTSVDWTNVMSISRDAGLRVVSFERQDKFLLRSGALEELERMTDESPSETAALRASAREMILPDGMSASFQVLVLKK